MAKIMITCDLCGKTHETNNVMAIQADFCGLWIQKPSMEDEKFICKECLEKLGWTHAKKSTRTGEDTTPPSDPLNTTTVL